MCASRSSDYLELIPMFRTRALCAAIAPSTLAACALWVLSSTGCTSSTAGGDGIVAAKNLSWSCSQGSGATRAELVVECANTWSTPISNDCSAAVAGGGSYCATLKWVGPGPGPTKPLELPRVCHDKLLTVGQTDSFQFEIPAGQSCDGYFEPVVSVNGQVVHNCTLMCGGL